MGRAPGRREAGGGHGRAAGGRLEPQGEGRARLAAALHELARGLPGGSRMRARESLLGELREHALVIGEVTLSSGRKAQYYVDAKRALLRPTAYRAAGALIAAGAAARGAAAVGGMTIGPGPLSCAAIGPGRAGGRGGLCCRRG